MSFDFTTASTFKPKVENTFLGKGGGGGNTGYFQQGKKKKDEDSSILSQVLSKDALEKFNDVDTSETELEVGLLEKIKRFLKK